MGQYFSINTSSNHGNQPGYAIRNRYLYDLPRRRHASKSSKLTRVSCKRNGRRRISGQVLLCCGQQNSGSPSTNVYCNACLQRLTTKYQIGEPFGNCPTCKKAFLLHIFLEIYCQLRNTFCFSKDFEFSV